MRSVVEQRFIRIGYAKNTITILWNMPEETHQRIIVQNKSTDELLKENNHEPKNQYLCK